MLFGYLLLAVALTISLTAAFYSIAGLTAIFAAAATVTVAYSSIIFSNHKSHLIYSLD